MVLNDAGKMAAQCWRAIPEHFPHVALDVFVVMPNHVHILMEIADQEELPKIVHSWKSFTAKRINAVIGGYGDVWQKEYFDRLIRNAEHYGRTLEYIRRNAKMARG